MKVVEPLVTRRSLEVPSSRRKPRQGARAGTPAPAEWFSVTTSIGPSRYGFDFEMIDLVTIREKGTILDLPGRASYGIFRVKGSCTVAWQHLSDLPTPTPPIGSESQADIAARLGTLTADFGIDPAGPGVTVDCLPSLKAGKGGRRTEINELILGSTYRVTIISRTDDVVLMVFSSDGPGGPITKWPPIIS